MHSPITITRTIYDPALKDFVFNSSEGRALPNIRQWIDKKNPVIYWYVLRVDNTSEFQLEQWAIELYTHQALNITDAYVDGIDRRFELKKREHDPWSDKYILSIPKQLGIPIVGSGTRRIFFKVDVNCREGLMHEYSISGKFIAEGIEAVDIRKKMFCYSCKVGEFRQIFDKNPEEASVYAEKRLSTRYSSNSVQVFTNSFRMIHDLYRYCHSGLIERDDLMHKLHLLHTSFEKVPEIADKRINPLLNNGIRELDVLLDREKFKSRCIRLCDSLVELLHIEVVGYNLKEDNVSSHPKTSEIPSENQNIGNMKDDLKIEKRRRECHSCLNLIDSSNRSLLCGECEAQFCQICESWFREERMRGEKPLCEKCFTAKYGRRKQGEEERIKKEKEEQEKLNKQREEERIRTEKEANVRLKKEMEELRKQREEEEKARTGQEEQERLRKQREQEIKRINEDRKSRKLEEQERLRNQVEKRKEIEENDLGEEKKIRKEEREEAERKQREKENKSKVMFFVALVICIILCLAFYANNVF